MCKILIIEDDMEIASIERDYLSINDYETEICDEPVRGIERALSGEFDLILLDLMLPGMDGFSVCKHLREQLDIPIIIVSAKGEDSSQILGLGFGADDYITKPFEPALLVARVKANLALFKRSAKIEPEQEEWLSCGGIRANKTVRRAFLFDKEIELKNKEFDLLYYFMQHIDMVLNKDQLYEAIWGMDALGDVTTVAVHVNRLRNKLGDDPANPTYLGTVWGMGYRFSVPN